jgi:hypothetical protein
MNLQPTYNEFGSAVTFYRFQTRNSGTTYDSHFGFLAGDYHEADHFQNVDYDKQRSIVKNHSNWSIAKPSPFISTTSDLAWAINVAKKIRRTDPIYIAEISPGRATSGSIRYYHWFELVRELNANIEHKAKNNHETVFLGQIPQEAITWYGTVEESERHNFEEEEDEDSEQEQEEEYEEEEHEEEEYYEEDEGEGYPSIIVHILTKTRLMNSELLRLMSQLKMDRYDEQDSEGEEETEEVEDSGEEWYNEGDYHLKLERARADEEEGEEEVKNLTLIYNQMIAELMDDLDEQYFWGEDLEEEDFDIRAQTKVGALSR